MASVKPRSSTLSNIWKFFVGAALVASLSPAPVAQAQSRGDSGGPFGLGLILGSPTALTAKYRMDSRDAIDGGLAFDLNKWFLFYGDYLYHFPGGFGRQNKFLAETTPYVGIGGLLVVSNQDEFKTRKERYFSESSSSKTAIGLRIPLGAEWRPSGFPVGVYLEFAPGLTIMPGTDGFVQGGLGARFYF